MKAITVRYHGPTNYRGSRLIASDLDNNKVTVGYRSELNHDDNFREAAKALCSKMKWQGKLAHGGLDSGADVFVWVASHTTFEV
jgi:hypothetical protein